MDPLTHTATGLFLSRAGLNRWTPLATPILDPGGQRAGYRHRHGDRRVLELSALSPRPHAFIDRHAGDGAACGGGGRLAWRRKKIRWVGAFFAALIAVASHLLLDLTNSYGVRIFAPFSSRWMHLDLTNVIDIWIWAVLLVCIVGPLISRLVSSEITSGSRQNPLSRPRLRRPRPRISAVLQLRARCAARPCHGRARFADL